MVLKVKIGCLNQIILHFNKQNKFDLPYLYRNPKLYKSPIKAGSSKCSTQPLSLLLTQILTVVKEKL